MAENVSLYERVRALDRRVLETRLEAFVARNRFEIAVVVPLSGAVALIAGARGVLPPAIAFAPLVVLSGTAIMRLPLIVGVAPLLDRRAGGFLAGLCGYAYLIEFVGVRTGWPYGAFSYGVELGPMLGGVPLGLPLFFLPLVLDAYLLVLLLLGPTAKERSIRLPAALGVVLVVDLVLDPGAVALGFWSYADGGAYYGVPLSNYLGWGLSGAVGVLALDRAFDREALLARLVERPFMLDDLVSFVVLWGLVNLAFANWIPVFLTGLLVTGLLSTDRFDVRVRPSPRFRR